MRLRLTLLPMMIIFALLLAACGPQDNQNGNAVGTVFPEGAGTAAPGEIPETGDVVDETEPPSDVEPAPTLEAETETAPEMDATPTTEPTAAATLDATPTLDRTEEPADGLDGASGILGIPETGSGDLAGLSALVGFEIEDINGNAIGTVRDYVINMCEAYILYLVVDPQTEVGDVNGSGQVLLIPYEAVLEMPNDGRVDLDQRLFVINTDAAGLADAPTVDFENLDLQTPQVWDDEILLYWATDFDLARNAACNIPLSGPEAVAGDVTVTPDVTEAAPNTPADATQPAVDQTPTAVDMRGTDHQGIYRIALASHVLEAELQDGNGQRLGSLQEIAIVPETGRTQYLLIQPEDAAQDGLVPLPPGAVNVMYEEVGDDQPVLVLLVENEIYRNAPSFDRTAGTTDDDWFNYWDQYLPMTMEQLP